MPRQTARTQGGEFALQCQKRASGGSIRAESKEEPESCDACVNGRPGAVGRGRAFILTEERKA